MNLLRQRLAALLTDSTRRGINALDPHSPCTQVLEKIDVDGILDQDIARICKTVSYAEIARILSLAARAKISPQEKKRTIKGKLKKIAGDIVARTEKGSGKLGIPDPCRHLLLNL